MNISNVTIHKRNFEGGSVPSKQGRYFEVMDSTDESICTVDTTLDDAIIVAMHNEGSCINEVYAPLDEHGKIDEFAEIISANTVWRCYRLVTAKELAEFMYNQPLEQEFSFAIHYTIIPGEDILDEKYYPEDWFGIKKTKVFGCDTILVGQYGTFAHTIIDAEHMDISEISEEMERFFANWTEAGAYGRVYLDIRNTKLAKGE